MNSRQADRLSRPVLEAIEQLTTWVEASRNPRCSRLAYDALDCRTVAQIQRSALEPDKRNLLSRTFNAKSNKDTVTAWRADLDRILHVFEVHPTAHPLPTLLTVRLQTELALHTHVAVSDIREDVVDIREVFVDVREDVVDIREGVVDIREGGVDIREDVANARELISDVHRAVVKGQEGAGISNQMVGNRGVLFTVVKFLHFLGQNQVCNFNCSRRVEVLPLSRILGESPPPPPGACFGREELIEKIVILAESLTSIALIGPGGIGKTFVALSALHDDRIKKRFGESRRFIRCDKFPPAQANLLNHLSKAIGAGIENPEDLATLRPFLSSKEIFIVLDNAESILDPQGPDAQNIYTVVEELSRFETISLCITSRISTVPPHCDRPIIPTLSVESACDIFYGIYKNTNRSDIVRELVRQLDFHVLSITLLATTAAQNMWDHNRLAKEWGVHRAQVLRTVRNESLGAVIELSLASPTFHNLDPIARELLGVIAFLPQGVNENNLDWLFPTISNIAGILDTFCALSLTYRSTNSITMLAPLRDYLGPQDPRTSPLLCATKDCYFRRLQLLGDLEPDQPGFGESRWIRSEDVNVEHLLNIFASFDTDLDDIWDACSNFMAHLVWHKPRFTTSRRRIEGLSDDHRSKPRCLLNLSQLLGSLGNRAEQKRLLTYTLELERGRGEDDRVAHTLWRLADANRMLGLQKEGVRQLEGALEIYE